MKRAFLILLIITVMISSVFSGCEKKTEESVSETTINETKEIKDENKKIESEITVWTWEGCKNGLVLMTDKFNEAYPGITVNYETMPNGDLYQKYILAAQAGEGGPDVLTVESEILPQMIKTKSLMDISDRLGDDINKINDHKIKLASDTEGKIYAAPWDSGPVALAYNRKIFKEAGLPSEPEEVAKILQTWDDYYEVMKQIKEKTGAYAFATAKTKVRVSQFEIMMSQKAQTENSWVFDKEGNVKFDSPQGVRVAEFLTQLFDEDLIYDAARYTQQFSQAHKDDKMASTIGAAWLIQGVLKRDYGEDHINNWGVVPLPLWDEGDARTAEDGGSNLSIPKNTKNLEAAWAYVKFHMLNDESHITMYKNGFFPSWEPAYGNSEVSKPDEFFGGQNTVQLFEELAKEVPAVNFTEDHQRAVDAIKVALELCYNDKSKTVEEHLKSAADEVRAKTGRK